jgi:hypothetical protein
VTDARATQVALEQWAQGTAQARATQVALEQWASVAIATGTAYAMPAAAGMYGLFSSLYGMGFYGSGTYGVGSGQASLVLSRSSVAAQGAYSLAGQPIGFLKAHGFIGESGSYALQGNPQVLRQAGFGAVKGAYALSGQAATLAVGMTTGPGSYGLSGYPMAFPASLSLHAGSGLYAVSGFSPSGGAGSGPPFTGRHSREFIADVGPGMTRSDI